MNKIISINIGGRVFNIEEDAYGELKKYLEEIKIHFETASDNGEIVSDIEDSIADQLLEKTKNNSRAVTGMEVKEVIESMGTVSAISADESEEQENKHSPRGKNKKLFRDEDKSVIAGVCAGLAAYFDIDPIWPRLLFLISIFFGGTGVIAYIILWIAMPAAKTPAEKMEMRGKNLTLANFQENFEGRDNGGAVKKVAKIIPSIIRQVVKALVRIIKYCLHILKYLIAIALVCIAIFITVGSLVSFMTLSMPFGSYYIDFGLRQLISLPLYGFLLLILSILFLIPAVAMTIIGISILKTRQSSI
jgi:phage shock protein PspC (stress-responsive transcriptional regulator)